MITCLYGIGRFHGAAVLLAVYGGCLVLCIGIGLLFPCNRTQTGSVRLLGGIAAASAVMDVLLLLVLFPHGTYQNYGIGSAYGVLIYPVILVLAAVILTAWNKDEM